MGQQGRIAISRQGNRLVKARIGAGLVCAFATGAAQAGPEDYIACS